MDDLLKYKIKFVADTDSPSEPSKHGAHRIGRVCYLNPDTIKVDTNLIAIYSDARYFLTTRIEKIENNTTDKLLTITTRNSIYTFKKLD